MTAQIAGFHSRAELGMRAPRSISTNITPSRGGVALHWGGAGAAPADHEGCKARWRGWQSYHMDGRGWVDIAYNFGFCDHGYVLAGRGFGVRSAAQGTNDGNQRFYAAVWVGGAASTPTPLALDAAEWIVAESQRAGGAGRVCLPHWSFHKTDCPGLVLAAKADQLNGTTPPAPTPTPAPPPPPKPTRRLGTFPLPAGHWFGPESSNRRNHSGYWAGDRPHIAALLNALRGRGWANVPRTDRYTTAVAALIRRYQDDAGIGVDGLTGAQTWESVATSPVR